MRQVTSAVCTAAATTENIGVNVGARGDQSASLLVYTHPRYRREGGLDVHSKSSRPAAADGSPRTTAPGSNLFLSFITETFVFIPSTYLDTDARCAAVNSEVGDLYWAHDGCRYAE